MTTCPNCGANFTGSRTSQTFCTRKCREAFHDLQAIRGKVAMPFLLVWRGGKQGASEASTYAFAQLCALADRWRAEDRAAGRDPAGVVTVKMDSAWRAVDLT